MIEENNLQTKRILAEPFFILLKYIILVANIEVKETGKRIDRDALQIKDSHIIANINVLKFTDADSGQSVCYIPSLEISGYGENDEKAIEMTKFSIQEYFSYLNSFGQKIRKQNLYR